MIFENGVINLTKIKNKKSFLIGLGKAIYNLTISKVYNGKISLGGLYHKNYYRYICGSFFNNKNEIILQKNALNGEFIFNLKHNLCNFGLFFYKQNGCVFIKIYLGNMFLLDENIQNNIEKFISENKNFSVIKPKFAPLINYYEKDFLKNFEKFKFKIISKNKRIKYYIKKFNLSLNYSNNKVLIDKNLNYKLKFKSLVLNKKITIILSKNNIDSNEKMIEKINLKNLKCVANRKKILYNKDVNYFDIFYTLHIISTNLNYE